VKKITGGGTTLVLSNGSSGSLTVQFLVQGTLMISQGAVLTLSPRSDALADSSASLPVPEPGLLALLLTAALGIGLGWRKNGPSILRGAAGQGRGRNRKV